MRRLPRPAAVMAVGASTAALLATVVTLTVPAASTDVVPDSASGAAASLAQAPDPAPPPAGAQAGAPGCAAAGGAAAGAGGAVACDPAGAAVAPAAPTAGEAGPTLVVGDSIALGSADSLRRALGAGTVVDAKVGRQFSAAPAIVGRWPGAGPVVVDLGANGTVQAADIDAVIDAAGDRRVVLVGVHVPRRWQDGNNDVLRAAAAAHPTVEFVDWGALVAAHPGALGPDGVHPGLTGRTLLASAVADAARHP